MATTICSATVGNYNAEIQVQGIRGSLVIEESVGGWWTEKQRYELPLSPKDAARALSPVRTVATPTYERIFKLATKGL